MLRQNLLKNLCSLEMSGQGDEHFPWLNVMSQPCTAGLLLRLCCQHHQPPAAASAWGYMDALPSPGTAILPPAALWQRATNELARSIRCSVASGWLQPPQGHGTPPPAPRAWGCRVGVSANRAVGLRSRSWARRSLPAALWMPRQAGITAGLLWLIIGCNDGLQD